MHDRTRWDALNREVFRHYRLRAPGDYRDWHLREYTAQAKRGPLEWGNEAFWREGYTVWKYHFAHVSIEDPSLVAYTPDDDKGERGIQTRIKPGRYLKEFFGYALTEKQIAYYAVMHANGSKPRTPWDDYEFGLATTQKEIAEVYIHGPHSCMDGRHFKATKTHPCRVYAAGDLAIAYLKGDPAPNRTDRDSVYVARALVWPEKKIYSRIYPTPDFHQQDGFESVSDASACQAALMKKLQAKGYAPGSLNNAWLLKLPRKTAAGYGPLRNGVYMPFVDGGYKVTDKEDHLVLDKNGDFHPGTQSGHLELRHPYDCRKCEKNVKSTQRVFTHYHADREYYDEEDWCVECCTAHTFRCDGLRVLRPRDAAHETLTDGIFSVSWLTQHGRRHGIAWSGWKPEDDVKKPARKRTTREQRVIDAGRTVFNDAVPTPEAYQTLAENVVRRPPDEIAHLDANSIAEAYRILDMYPYAQAGSTAPAWGTPETIEWDNVAGRYVSVRR